MKDSKKTLYYNCAFCGRSPGEVKKIIAGKYANICNECVVLCVDVLVNGETEQEKQGGDNEPC